jgi:hypothetical protein
MKTSKKQIKKQLKKAIKLVSKLSKKKVKSNLENLVTLHQGVMDMKTIVKYIIKQKNQKNTEEVQKDLETV